VFERANQVFDIFSLSHEHNGLLFSLRCNDARERKRFLPQIQHKKSILLLKKDVITENFPATNISRTFSGLLNFIVV
jgi:hypothetical protein